MADSKGPDLNNLTAAQVQLVSEIASALRQPVKANIAADSDICSGKFVESFQNRLVLHHALTEQPLTKKEFEYAFARSMRACGKTATINDDPTYPGTDVEVDGVSFSLKTEGARSIQDSTITISKLMEARWIRECRTGQDFLDHVNSRIVPHLKNYDRILTLRSFPSDSGFVSYQLIEIPRALLLSVSNLDADSFGPRTTNGSSSADVTYKGATACKLSLDGSVEKITVRGLRTSLCKQHASWVVPLRRN